MNVEIIKNKRPPNFMEILEFFPMAMGDGVIFAYGDEIYVPSGRDLPPELLAHELVHCERQKSYGLSAWWDRYLRDAEFRFHEELLAHQAEYQYLVANAASRQLRRAALKQVARKLASPLYKRMVTVKQAMSIIAQGVTV